jgi:hypothetical protein
MYGAIQTLVTLNRGACMGIFNHVLHLRGVYVWGHSTPCYTYEGFIYGAIQPLVTLKRGVCLGLLNLLLHVRRVYVWSHSTPCYT